MSLNVFLLMIPELRFSYASWGPLAGSALKQEILLALSRFLILRLVHADLFPEWGCGRGLFRQYQTVIITLPYKPKVMVTS